MAQIRLGHAPYMLVVLAFVAIGLGLFTHAMPEAKAEIGLVEFFTSATGLGIAAAILVYSCAAGLFVVPIFAAVQAWSPVDRRARVIGANNTLNSVMMVVGTLAASILLKTTGIDEFLRARRARRAQPVRRRVGLAAVAEALTRLTPPTTTTPARAACGGVLGIVTSTTVPSPKREEMLSEPPCSSA